VLIEGGKNLDKHVSRGLVEDKRRDIGNARRREGKGEGRKGKVRIKGMEKRCKTKG